MSHYIWIYTVCYLQSLHSLHDIAEMKPSLKFCRLKFSHTLMCISIGTPKTVNFPFVPNGKFIIFNM